MDQKNIVYTPLPPPHESRYFILKAVFRIPSYLDFASIIIATPPFPNSLSISNNVHDYYFTTLTLNQGATSLRSLSRRTDNGSHTEQCWMTCTVSPGDVKRESAISKILQPVGLSKFLTTKELLIIFPVVKSRVKTKSWHWPPRGALGLKRSRTITFQYIVVM